MDFGRMLTAMVTPFDNNLAVDYQQAGKIAEYLVNNGSDGIVVAGSTGEGATLTHEEKINLFKLVKDTVGHRAKVIAGTGSNSTADSIALTQAAEKAGVDGVMLVVPYYNKPSQEGIYRHFKAIAESTSLPIMLYNIPSRTGINMVPSTVSRLAEIDNIVTLKESAGMIDQVSELVRCVPDDFKIYSGDDSLTLPMLSLGCHGIVSVCAHVIGNQIQSMIKAYLTGNVAEAAQLHRQLFPVFKNLFITTNPVPVKLAIGLLGLNPGGVRPPLIEATTEEFAVVKKTLEELKLI
ncbi:MAG: 4-hydroxy-tetrahydrodipicolinate synthase [Clostridia bacterium]|nr:4-hydroxy-tetrahydrodipicolinate synthase [Clostridia bacterium]